MCIRDSFKHEGGNTIIADNGKVVVYMGDDERFDYMYKFVSAGTYKEGDKKHNMSLLTEGDLYVAKFTGDGFEDGVCDGTGTWIPLVKDGKSAVEGCPWPRCSSSPASPPTRWAPPRWTAPRTSSPTRSTARSTPR